MGRAGEVSRYLLAPFLRGLHFHFQQPSVLDPAAVDSVLRHGTLPVVVGGSDSCRSSLFFIHSDSFLFFSEQVRFFLLLLHPVRVRVCVTFRIRSGEEENPSLFFCLRSRI